MSSNPAGTIGRSNVWKVRYAQLTVREGFNARIDLGDIDQLADSIAENGVERALNVIRGEGDTFELIDGHRRHTAIGVAIKAGKIDASAFDIPVLIADKNMSELDRVAMMARANDGKPFTAIEEATLYQRMKDGGMSVADICKAVGKSNMHVRKHFDLMAAPTEVKDALQGGQITRTLALSISGAARKGKINAAELVAQAVAGGKEAKAQVHAATDAHTARKYAIRVKLDNIKEAQAEVTAKIKARLEEIGMSRAELKEKLGDKYEAVRLIGMEAGLRHLVNEYKGDEE
jgi:ParB/RepB/Spo0J family partition protein